MLALSLGNRQTEKAKDLKNIPEKTLLAQDNRRQKVQKIKR